MHHMNLLHSKQTNSCSFCFLGLISNILFLMQLFFFLFSFFGSPSTVGLFSPATLKYGLVVWQALRGTLLSSWNVCLFATIAIFAAWCFFINSLKKKKTCTQNKNKEEFCLPDCFNRHIKKLEFHYIAIPTGTWCKLNLAFSAQRKIMTMTQQNQDYLFSFCKIE